MSNAPEIQRLTYAITDLAAAILEILNAKVLTLAHGASLARPDVPFLVAAYDPLLTKRQLAAHFQVSSRTIDVWMQRRHLPYYTLGKVVRFRLTDVQAAWDAKLKRHACPPAPGPRPRHIPVRP